MKACFLILLAIGTAFATLTNDGQYPTSTGGDGQTSKGGSEATGEVYRPISTSDGADATPNTFTFDDDDDADDKLISDILSQVNYNDGLPMDLISSLVSGDGYAKDDDSLMAQLHRMIQLEPEGEDDAADKGYGQISGDGGSHTTSDSSGSEGSGYMPQTVTGQTGAADDNGHDDDDDDDSSKSITALVLKQLDVAKQIFENAKSQIVEAEMAGKADTSVGSAVSSHTRLAASSVITSAKAKARTSILGARKDYLLAIDTAKRDITVMKILEKRFRVLAVAFAKARNFAGKAIMTLKRLAPEADDDDDDDDDDDNSREYGYRRRISSSSRSKRTFLSAVAAAKSNIAKMKSVEKSFISITKALAKARALAYTKVRTVRKSGISLAQVMSTSEVAVKAALDTAKSLISQAISTSRATAYARYQVSSALSQKAETQAHLAIQLAANALTAAKERAATSSSSLSEDSHDDDDDDGNDVNNDYGANVATQLKGADDAQSQSSTIADSDKGYY